MSEGRSEQLFHNVAAGDVFAMDTTVMALVLLIVSKDEGECDPLHGPKVYFRWLAHHEADKITTCEWMYESSLRLKSVWLKVTSAS